MVQISAKFGISFDTRQTFMPWGCLRFVIVVFPDHTHLLFSKNYFFILYLQFTLHCAVHLLITFTDNIHAESFSVTKFYIFYAEI